MRLPSRCSGGMSVLTGMSFCIIGFIHMSFISSVSLCISIGSALASSKSTLSILFACERHGIVGSMVDRAGYCL